jgi:hypothetical protein
MTEVKYRSDKGGPEKRIADRLKNSGDAQHADHVVQKGSSPNRTFTNVHHTRNQQYGDGAKGSGIFGEDRGPANRKGEV